VVAKIGDWLNSTAPNKKIGRGGTFRDLMPHVQRFRIPYVNAQAPDQATPEFWKYPMRPRSAAALVAWRVALLGDAAIRYVRSLGQRIAGDLDARSSPTGVCGRAVASHALWGYEQERLPMTTDRPDEPPRRRRA
jgi:hypothetical protein